MATFTMALHEVLGVDSPGDADPARIGLDQYPIWDLSYREVLNTKIVKRFWNREIGVETVSLFRFNMDRLMGEIMPYYNELAKTTGLDFDYFETVNMVNESDSETQSTSTGKNTTDTSSTSSEQSESSQDNTSENASRTVNSEHPQTRLNEFEDYATASAEAVSESTGGSTGESSGTANQSGTGEGTSQGEQHNTARDWSQQRGTQGNKSAMLQQYRDTILGVDTLILEELEVLFMGVWDTDQSYTRVETPYLYPHGWF